MAKTSAHRHISVNIIRALAFPSKKKKNTFEVQVYVQYLITPLFPPPLERLYSTMTRAPLSTFLVPLGGLAIRFVFGREDSERKAIVHVYI